jgi:hypothetical protein
MGAPMAWARLRRWSAFAGAILLVAARLAPVTARAQDAGDAAALPDTLRPPDLQSVIWQFYDALPPPVGERACELAPEAPFVLPPRPRQPALGVVFADGRPARWDPLEIQAGQLYWPMEDACSALGGTLVWDPDLFLGRLLIDTLAVRFAVGAEIFHCADSARQATAPVLYLGNHLLLPVDAIGLLVDPFLSHRFAFSRDSLLLRQRSGLPAARAEVYTDLGRTHLVWRLDRQPAASIQTDGARTLVVELPGVGVDVRRTPRAAVADHACLRGVWPMVGGTRFVFRVDPGTVAWQALWNRERHEFHVILSSREEDQGRMDAFPHWPAVRRPGGSAANVILVLPGGSAPHGRGRDGRLDAANEFVCALGDRIGRALQDRGGTAILLEDDGSDDPGKRPTAQANARGGALCLFLDADACGDTLAQGYRIVSAATRPGARPLLSVTDPLRSTARGMRVERDGAGPALRPWESVAPQHAERSEDLAWFLDLHLRAARTINGAASRGRVVRQHWPGGPLEGLDMPGAVLYVGRSSAAPGFPVEEDWNRLESVGEAIALAIEAFLLQEGPR